MKKTVWLLAGVALIVIVLVGIFILHEPADIVLTSYEYGEDVKTPVDVVFYPFFLDGQALNISGYSLKGKNLTEQSKNVDIGYSSVIEVDAIEPLLKHFDAVDLEALHDELGQYFSYHNFFGMEVFVFCEWDTSPRVLNVIFLREGEIILLSDEIGESFLPIALIKDNSNVYILLRDNKQFVLKGIDTKTYDIKNYKFDLFSFSSKYFYYIDTFINDGKLYLFMNEYDQENATNENSGFIGGYMAIINLDTNDITEYKLSDTKLDFAARDEGAIIWGQYGKGLLSCELCDFNGVSQKKFEILINENYYVTPNSAYYSDNLLLLNLTGYNADNDQQGVFLVIDVEAEQIASRWSYKYAGGIYIRYYASGSNFQYEAQYSTAS